MPVSDFRVQAYFLEAVCTIVNSICIEIEKHQKKIFGHSFWAIATHHYGRTGQKRLGSADAKKPSAIHTSLD